MEKEAEKIQWIRNSIKHIAFSIMVIIENMSKDGSSESANNQTYSECVDLGLCCTRVLNAARALSLKPSNSLAKGKLIDSLKSTLDVLNKNFLQSKMARNIKDLADLVQNTKDKIESNDTIEVRDRFGTLRKAALTLGRGKSERSLTVDANDALTPQTATEEIIQLSKVLIINTKTLLEVLQADSPRIKEFGRDIVEAVKKIHAIATRVSDETGHDRPSKVASHMKIAVSNIISIIKETDNSKASELQNKLSTIANHDLPDLVRELIHEVMACGSKVIADKEITTATEKLRSSASKLSQAIEEKAPTMKISDDNRSSLRGIITVKLGNSIAEDESALALLQTTEAIALEIADKIGELSDLLKVQSKTKLFQVAKEIGVKTGELASCAADLFGDKCILKERMAQLTNEEYDFSLSIRNAGVKLLGAAKNVILSQFSVSSGFDLATTSTTFSESISTFLSTVKDALVPPQTSLGLSVAMDDLFEEIWEDEPDDEEHVMLDKDDNGAERLKAGSLNKLVERLTSDKTEGNLGFLKFTKNFLTTYRSFTTPHELFGKLVLRYSVKLPRLPLNITADEYVRKMVTPIQLRAINVMKMWMETSYFDFDAKLLNRVENFIQHRVIPDGNEKLAAMLRNAIKKLQAKRSETEAPKSNILIEPTTEVDLYPSQLFDRFSAEDIAKAFCVIDGKVFKMIKPMELLNQAWSKPELKYRSIHVGQTINRFNQVSGWTSSIILWQERIDERVKVYKKMIALCEYLIKFNNFNGLMAVLSGINDAAVFRLKYTIAELPEKSKQAFANASHIMDNQFSFKNYRERLHQSDPPIIPFLGVYLTDLTFINDGNPDKIKNLINFRKRELESDVILEIQLYQQLTHNFAVDQKLMNLLNNLPFNDKDKLYQLSLVREPRGAERSDIT
eukprot:TRINITY_DN269_c0_g2_i3.p1 TRINITY_DN269_c0_g2~~TRINITY_DN269_c0_g2_i3.p1  ORF type:complete len:1067 (+),score=282.01 TRINITY_DN269_c0_g2_i3:478-3201(+)